MSWPDRLKSLAQSASNNKQRMQQFATNSELHSELRNSSGAINKSVTDEFTKLMTGRMPIEEVDLKQGKGAWDTIRAVSYTHLTLPTILLV